MCQTQSCLLDASSSRSPRIGQCCLFLSQIDAHPLVNKFSSSSFRHKTRESFIIALTQVSLAGALFVGNEQQSAIERLVSLLPMKSSVTSSSTPLATFRKLKVIRYAVAPQSTHNLRSTLAMESLLQIQQLPVSFLYITQKGRHLCKNLNHFRPDAAMATPKFCFFPFVLFSISVVKVHRATKQYRTEKTCL